MSQKELIFSMQTFGKLFLQSFPYISETEEQGEKLKKK